MLFKFKTKNKSAMTKLERIYEKYCNDMYCEAYKILQSKTKAEDSVHLAVERIIKNQHKIDENDVGRTRMYLLVICRNVAYSMLSDDEKRKYGYYDDNMQVEENEPLNIVITKENMSELLGCINSLKPIYRDALMLKFYNDYSNSEVSAALGITETTLRKRLERARKQLKELLEKEAEKDAKY